MSPDLNRPLRPLRDVTRDLLANMSDQYFILCRSRGEFYWCEMSFGTMRGTIVKLVAEGQYDDAVAVLRIARDAPAENVSEDIAREVVTYLNTTGGWEDRDGYRVENSFLDEVWPEWINNVPAGRINREYDKEDAA